MAELSVNQSLFQVYYLGSSDVDRRCSSAVIPWIIEDLKLRLDTDMNLVWITLGPTSISYVADSGEEMQKHSYDTILRYSKGMDAVSFGYIISSNGKTLCHVFQSLAVEEAAVITDQFGLRCNSYGIRDKPIYLNSDTILTLTKQSKLQKIKSKTRSGRRGSIDPTIDTSYPVQYCGAMNINFKKIRAGTVDAFVSCLRIKDRPHPAEKYKKWRRGKRTSGCASPQTNRMSRLQSAGSDDIDIGSGGVANIEEESLHPVLIKQCTDPTSESIIAQEAPNRPRAISDISGLSTTLPEIHVSDSQGSTPTSPLVSQEKKRQWSFKGLRRRTKSANVGQNTTGLRVKSLKKSSSDVLERSISDNGDSSVEEGGSLGGNALPTPAIPISTYDTPNASSNEDTDNDSSHDDGSRGNDSHGNHDLVNSKSVGDDVVDGESVSDDDIEFDLIPELQVLRDEPEFSALGSMENIIRKVREDMSGVDSATLVISGQRMSITTLVRSGEDDIARFETKNMVETLIQHVLCCAQGTVSGEYVAFSTRQKGSRIITLHLLRTVTPKKATQIVKAFKAAFDYCITNSLPNSLCESCPLKNLNNLCQSLNELPLSEAHLKLSELLLSFMSEAEYLSLVKEYRKEPFENEHAQLVRWVYLIYTFFHRQQEHHHHGNKPDKAGKKNLLSMKSLTSSYDNLRHRQVKKDPKFIEDGLQSRSASDFRILNSSVERLSSPLATASLSVPHTNNVIEDDYVIVTQAESEGSLNSSPDTQRQRRIPPSHSFPPTDMRTSPHSMEHCSNSRPRTDSGSPMLDVGAPPIRRGHTRSMSWRQQMFENVTPGRRERRETLDQIMNDTAISRLNKTLSFAESLPEEQESPSSRARRRWRWAIGQQILLIKIEKENRVIMKESLRYIKLDYEEEQGNISTMEVVWNGLLTQTAPSSEELLAALKMGVPPMLREKVWLLLISHYRSLHPGAVPLGSYHSTVDKGEYRRLCQIPTDYEMVIMADIGRTFPTHPYFSSQYKYGQETLYEILHAYSIADRELGYCQGLSFVAGVFLMHAQSEPEAFILLNHFMHLYGFRSLYLEDMFSLQTKLYQFSRLFHDHLPDLYNHFEKYDITPFLYAAPWFLTVFASQFPMSFVAKVMDFVLYEGIQAIYKIGVALLWHYKLDLLELTNMETITNFVKTVIPNVVHEGMAEIIHTAIQLGDLDIKLQTYETEYQVMHELNQVFQPTVVASNFETMNEVLRKQNKDMIEQLAVCRGAVIRLENTVNILMERLEQQDLKISRLEQSNRHTTTGDDKGTPVIND